MLEPTVLQVGLAETAGTLLEHRGERENPGILLDFGVEIHGGVRLLTIAEDGRAQAAIRLRFGESASEAMTPVGDAGATNDHSVREMVVPIVNLSDMTFGQTGFRFVYLELLEEQAALWMKAVVAVAIYRDLSYIGRFSCADPLLGRIFDTAAYTAQLCMQRLIWDGIKRDRLVWVGDLYPECLAVLSVFGETALLEESLDFVRRETPLPGWMNGLPSYSAWWLLNVWELYWYSGEKRYLEQERQYVTELLLQICTCVEADGGLTLPQYFFDWPTNGTQAAMQGNRALFCRALLVGERIGNLYGDAVLSACCHRAAERLRTAPGEAGGYKQTAAWLLLQKFPDPDGTLQKTLLTDGAAGWSTFMSYFLLEATARWGGMTAALRALRDYYGGMLSVGATTFWEDFDVSWLPGAAPLDQWPPQGKDIHGNYGRFCYTGLRHSLCHGWSSGPVPFLLHDVLGVRWELPGGRRMKIAPSLGDLLYAEGSCPTVAGTVTVRCERAGDGTVCAYVTAPSEICVESGDGVRLVRE